MFLEQFVIRFNKCMFKRYLKDSLKLYKVYKLYTKTKQRLNTNIKNIVVTSNIDTLEVINENSCYICEIF